MASILHQDLQAKRLKEMLVSAQGRASAVRYMSSVKLGSLGASPNKVINYLRAL